MNPKQKNVLKFIYLKVSSRFSDLNMVSLPCGFFNLLWKTLIQGKISKLDKWPTSHDSGTKIVLKFSYLKFSTQNDFSFSDLNMVSKPSIIFESALKNRNSRLKPKLNKSPNKRPTSFVSSWFRNLLLTPHKFFTWHMYFVLIREGN